MLRVWQTMVIILLISCQAVVRADSTISQRGINELAAKCIDAQSALSGIRPLHRPGETHATFVSRVQGYMAAIDTIEKSLAPIRRAPSLHSRSPENRQLWQRLTTSVTRLPLAASTVRAAWKATPKMGDKAQLGPSLFGALSVIESILNGLRDARP